MTRTTGAFALAALMLTGTAAAQEATTFIMRSGERISGQLVDLGGVGFTLRVNGVDRQLPTNSVAVIDFSGQASDADWSRIQAGHHVIVLRNGQTVDGQLYDIAGTNPLRITFRTSAGEREFSSSEIGRILLARPDNVRETTGQGAGGGIAVSAQQQWTPTGITVRRGETLSFRTTGEIRLSADANDIAGSAGSRLQRLAYRAPLPKVLAGALIGRIGNGRPFAIGDQASIQAPESGQLFLGINDDMLTDNEGEFRVEIQRSGSPIRR